jgi:membrane protein implicated in regulation of membrane protease activity
MAWIKRKWTAKEADEWTREDLFACIFSCICYVALAIGVALSVLLMWQGYVTLVVAIIALLLMYYVIDPKLRAISTEYEKKQKAYLEELEKTEKWEGEV